MKIDSDTAAILQARTTRLAAVVAEAEVKGARYSIATVDQELYAADFRAIIGVKAVTHVATLPGMSQGIGGLISFRGSPVVAFHTKAILGQQRSSLTERTQALIMGRPRAEFALLVDATEEVREISVQELSRAPETLEPKARQLVLGITEDGVIVLNVDHLFESERTLVSTYIGRHK